MEHLTDAGTREVGCVVTNPVRRILTAGLLAGCLAASGAVNALGAPAGKIAIGLSLADQNTPLSQELKRGAEDAGKEWGVIVEVRNAGGQASVQKGDLEALLALGVNAVLIQPLDPAAIAADLARVAKMGVPVITLATPVGDGSASLHVQTSSRVAGKLAAGHLKALVPQGNVLVIAAAGPEGADLAAGFEEALKDGPYRVSRATAADRAQAAAAVTGFVTQTGAAPAAVFGCSPEIALGALRGLNGVEGGLAVPVVGFGTNPEVLKALRLGRLSAVVGDKGWDIGHIGAEAALGLIRGKRLASRVVPADPLLLK